MSTSPTTGSASRLPLPSHHRNTESKQGKMVKSGGALGVPNCGALVDQGSRKMKLECDKFTEENLGHVFVKGENDWSANDGTTGNEGHEETFTVTKEEIDATLLSPGGEVDPDGQDQRSSCSCQEDIEILKCTLKQLAFQTEKQNDMIKRQNQIIGGMKSCIRNFAVSFTTFCDNDDDEDVDNLEELEIVETAGSPLEDPQQLRNSDIMSNAQMKGNQSIFPDDEKCSPVTIVNCTGNYSGRTQIPSVPSFASSTSSSSETFSNEASYMVGQWTNEDKTADINNANLEDDDDQDSSYVPDESKEEADQEMEDENSCHRATTAKSVKRKGDFKCWKCSKSFKMRNYLMTHMRRVHVEKKINCHLCTKLYKNTRDLRNHIQSIHEGVGYKCTYCPGKFDNLSNARRHEDKVHKKGGPLRQQCEICGIQLLTSSSLHKHMSRMHKDSEFSKRIQSTIIAAGMTTGTKTVFQCQLCPASFPDMEGLHSHQSRVHGLISTFGAEADIQMMHVYF